jgi:hypothetical protein
MIFLYNSFMLVQTCLRLPSCGDRLLVMHFLLPKLSQKVNFSFIPIINVMILQDYEDDLLEKINRCSWSSDIWIRFSFWPFFEQIFLRKYSIRSVYTAAAEQIKYLMCIKMRFSCRLLTVISKGRYYTTTCAITCSYLSSLLWITLFDY